MKFLLLCLRLLPPELAHVIALNSLQFVYKIKLASRLFPIPQSNSNFIYKNLTFKNKLGIAAGLDKNGDFIDALGALGFGFIEVGTVTPVPQHGNSKPRIFRFPAENAIINRLGFNNKGVDYLVRQVKHRKYSGILGINIGANKDSLGQKRIDDYVECFQKVAPYADYITINISSPNTPNLRALHSKDNFIPLFSALKQREKQCILRAQFLLSYLQMKARKQSQILLMQSRNMSLMALLPRIPPLITQHWLGAKTVK